MKYYTITVNGNTYDVSVEEGVRTAPAAAPAPVARPAAAAPAAAPAPAPKAAEAPVPAAASVPAAGGSTGSIPVSSPMPGKIVAVKAAVGQKLKKGEVILILEAMKMENEIVSPQDGTLASINVSAGQSVEAGTMLASLN
ncbi:glutaconyl-CoA decarboxylase [Anaerotaenia torta]|uniref:acetyl-CoA carboxylase biotin carboxyl carrier protein subunit n=1 Tax=Anaerotaenia torta TaxID=433293 RepID=UPI003D252709